MGLVPVPFPLYGFIMVKRIINAVSVLVVKGDKVLLGKRLEGVPRGWWSTPGGKQRFDEGAVECAIRELREETGLVTGILACENFGWSERQQWGGHFVTAYVLVRDFQGVPKALEPHKCKEWKWFKIDKLPTPCTEPEWVQRQLFVTVLARMIGGSDGRPQTT